MQHQCRKVDNVEEETNRYSGDAFEGKDPIPKHSAATSNREALQTTEWESKNGKQLCAIQLLE